MSELVELLFKGSRKELYANPMQFPFTIGDYAIVQADRGEDLGRINQLGPLLALRKIEGEPKVVLRKPSLEDLKRLEENRRREEEAIRTCKQKVKAHGLEMKVVDAEFQFDGNKLTFYFTAEHRVDFRELVKDLAAHFRTRIELRQIGVRDEARRLSGYGVCGQQLCCTRHIKEFQPVTTQCAKVQHLPLNPQKLAGVCGRLKCCLMYEKDFYEEATKRFPELKKSVTTTKGTATVEKIDVFKNLVYVQYPNDEWETLSLDVLNKCDGACCSAN